jgi:hypothetical protein
MRAPIPPAPRILVLKRSRLTDPLGEDLRHYQHRLRAPLLAPTDMLFNFYRPSL